MQPAVISALLMAVSANQIYFSQEARAYIMMVLLTLISFYFFWKLFEGKNYWILAGYALSSAALMYSHYYGILLIFAQALFVLGFYALRRHQDNAAPSGIWGLAAGAIALLYIPGFYYLAYMLIHPNSGNWTERWSVVRIGLFQYPWAPDSPSSLASSNEHLAMLTLFALIAICVLAMKRGERTALSLLLLWLIVPVALPLLLSQILLLPYAARYLTPALPALYLLVAVGIQEYKVRVALHYALVAHATL